MKLYVVVENYGLINEDAYVFTDGDEAERKYKEITGVDYKIAMRYFEMEKESASEEDYAKAGITDEIIRALDGEEHEQTKIYEVELRGIRICEYESINCPFCGSAKLQEHNLGKTELNQHQIDCLSCGGTFWLPCED